MLFRPSQVNGKVGNGNDSNTQTPISNMSIHIPSNMYTNDNTLSEIKDDGESILTSRLNGSNGCDGLYMQLSEQHKHEGSIIMRILCKLLSSADV